MSQNDTPTDSDSAPNVRQRFHLDLNGVDLEYNEIKCTTCKVVTPTQWVQIPVGAEPGFNPLKLLELRKRLTLCQNCGTLRLVK